MKKLIVKTIKNNKWSLLSIAICILVIGLIRQLFPFLFGNLIQSISDGFNLKKATGIVLCYSSLFVCAQLLHVIENITHADLFNNMLVSIRRQCFSSFLNASRKNVNEKTVGEIITIINEDVDKILEFISNCLINFISMSIELLAIVVFTIVINPLVALYIVLSVAVSFLISHNIGKIVQKLYDLYRQNKSDTLSFVIDVLEGRQEIIFMNAFSSISNLYVNHRMKQLKIEYRIKMRNTIIERANALIITICNVGLMGLSCVLIANNRMTMGNFISCTLYFETALAMMNFYGFLAHAIPESKASISRVADFIELEEEKNGTESIDSVEVISLRDLLFSYDDTNIAEPITTEVYKSELLFIDGESGTGKTTLLKCVLGLHDDYSGKIFFNNTELKNADKLSLRNRISVCLQGDELIEGETIRDNLCMGEMIDEKTIMQILKKLNIENYVINQQSGLDTVYSNESLGMSGGQKQRLLLARTLLKVADVYIFDEPTAAIDEENEKVICNVLNEIIQDKLVIVTSHRKCLKEISDKLITIRKTMQVTP